VETCKTTLNVATEHRLEPYATFFSDCRAISRSYPGNDRRAHGVTTRQPNVAFAKITAKITLVPDQRSIVAEDDSGASFIYGEECPSAAGWRGVDPGPDPIL
jgi:hypothetical protein